MIDLATNQLPITVLVVLLPLLGAVVIALIGSRNFAWWAALGVTFAVFVMTVMMALFVQSTPSISYFLGGVAPPLGIEYQIDPLNALIALLLAFIAVIMVPYARGSVEAEIPRGKQSLFYAAFLICFAGLMGMVVTHDIFNIYVFLEISSLATYALIAMGRDRRALFASFEYLIIGTIGATFILIGIGLLYIQTGTLNIPDIALRLVIRAHEEGYDQRLSHAAFAFIMIGLAMKVALFPLHIWLTNAYAYAPSFISSFLSATATKVGIYLFIRLSYDVFGFEYAFNRMPTSTVFMIMGAAGAVVGSLAAIYQDNIKRLLAFSSVAQIGYIAMMIGIATHLALSSALLHVINHALAKGALFMAVGLVAYRYGGVNMSGFTGLGRRAPVTAACFLIGAASLAGIPFTAGFVSKWYMLLSLIESGYIIYAALMVVTSLLALIYMWRVVREIYFRKAEGEDDGRPVPLMMVGSLVVLAGLNIYLGLDTRATLGLAMNASNFLYGI